MSESLVVCDTASLLSRIFPSSFDADADVDAEDNVDAAAGVIGPGVSLRSEVSAEDGLVCLGCRLRMGRVTSGLFSWSPFEEEEEEDDDDDDDDELLGGWLARQWDDDAKNLDGRLGKVMLLFAFV